MMKEKIKYKELITKLEQIPILSYMVKWIIITIIAGALIGSASALLLVTLDYVTNYRESHLWIIALLPLGGLAIGLMYHYWGENVVKGNNYLIEEINSPKSIIPFKMAPLIFIGTVITHLFGGSAGREGTAVQMGGAIADQFSRIFKMTTYDRKIMIAIGISAGFASVFGTPLAGAVFALEVIVIGRMRYEAILPSFLAAGFAHLACIAWGVHHTHYSIPIVVDLSISNTLWVILVGIICGLVALLFSKMTHFWTKLAKDKITYSPLRPFFGGIILVLVIWALGTTKYIGLGVPTIVASFTVQQEWYAFLLKVLLTTFTIGVGFKGGEVTPLFFIGATLGSALFGIIPLPMAFLAGMGFVGVFAGATNTPIACTLMGLELFGVGNGLYIGLVCVVAYSFSGHTGIYSSQIIGSPKHPHFMDKKGKQLK